MTTQQIVTLLVQVGLLVMSGVVGLVVRGAGAKLADLTREVAELRREVATQGKALAGGEQRFSDIERRLGEIERRVETVQTKGCARVGTCEAS